MQTCIDCSTTTCNACLKELVNERVIDGNGSIEYACRVCGAIAIRYDLYEICGREYMQNTYDARCVTDALLRHAHALNSEAIRFGSGIEIKRWESTKRCVEALKTNLSKAVNDGHFDHDKRAMAMMNSLRETYDRLTTFTDSSLESWKSAFKGYRIQCTLCEFSFTRIGTNRCETCDTAFCITCRCVRTVDDPDEQHSCLAENVVDDTTHAPCPICMVWTKVIDRSTGIRQPCEACGGVAYWIDTNDVLTEEIPDLLDDMRKMFSHGWMTVSTRYAADLTSYRDDETVRVARLLSKEVSDALRSTPRDIETICSNIEFIRTLCARGHVSCDVFAEKTYSLEETMFATHASKMALLTFFDVVTASLCEYVTDGKNQISSSSRTRSILVENVKNSFDELRKDRERIKTCYPRYDESYKLLDDYFVAVIVQNYVSSLVETVDAR